MPTALQVLDGTPPATNPPIVVDVDVEFLRDADGKVTGMNVLQDGKTMFAKKQ